ncbi:hypothetical protein NHF45_05785 [Maricaulaceae bacterium NA33B04]|nr:hypothetical protein [Maricaulaceae bacterium NA33B04]
MPSLSLSDRFFLPLFVLVCAGLIYLALEFRPAGDDAVMTNDRLVFEGAALAQLIPGPGTSSAFDPAATGGPVARASADSSLAAAGNQSAGVGALVPPEFEAAVVGRDIEVSITLRAEDPSHTQVAMGYFVVGGGDTGWLRREIPDDGSAIVLTHTIPADAPTGNNDWVGLWPDLEGAGRTVLVERIAVRILPEADPVGD